MHDGTDQNQRKNYQWPASALTRNEMAILASWKEQTKTPINELLRQAVVVCDRLVRKHQEGQDI